MNGLPNTLKGLGRARLAAMGAVGLALIAFFTALVLRASSPDMALLFGDITVEDSAQIVAKLEAMDVPFRLEGDGTSILVPRDRVLRLRMALAEAGLPMGGSIGYELFDRSSALGTTSFVQNINRLRALEGELARTIRSLDHVAAARVHLALPERELFARDRQEPTASIVVRMRGGTLSAGQVQAIQHLVAAAVEGLDPAKISLIDEHGRLLARSDGQGGEAVLAATLAEKNAAFEARLRQQIETLVASVVGPDNVRVQVAAELDFTRVTQNSEIFDPDGQVVRSVQSVEDSERNTETDAAETVSAANNLPDATAAPAGGRSSESTRSEETTNYEISRTTKTETQEAGRIKRISAAVLVNGSYRTGAEGTRAYQPRSAEEIATIEELVRSAIGYDAERGDQVRVANLRFTEPVLDAGESAPEGFLGLDKADYLRLSESLLLALVGLLVALLVLRPLLARLVPAPEHAGALPAPAGGLPMSGTPALAGPGMAQAALPAPSAPHQIETMLDISQIEGQVKEASVKKVGEIVNRYPEEAISIMRSWLYEPN